MVGQVERLVNLVAENGKMFDQRCNVAIKHRLANLDGYPSGSDKPVGAAARCGIIGFPDHLDISSQLFKLLETTPAGSPFNFDLVEDPLLLTLNGASQACKPTEFEDVAATGCKTVLKFLQYVVDVLPLFQFLMQQVELVQVSVDLVSELDELVADIRL